MDWCDLKVRIPWMIPQKGLRRDKVVPLLSCKDGKQSIFFHFPFFIATDNPKKKFHQLSLFTQTTTFSRIIWTYAFSGWRLLIISTLLKWKKMDMCTREELLLLRSFFMRGGLSKSCQALSILSFVKYQAWERRWRPLARSLKSNCLLCQRCFSRGDLIWSWWWLF